MQSGSNINANFPSRYRVESQLGEGAAGIVYLALDTELGCKVVIKALKHQATTDLKKVARFHNEFNALKNCIHPNIIRVFDFSEFNGLLFYTMEYLEGKTLHEAIYGDQAIPLDTAIEYLIQIAQGLAAVHQRGLIHRDLKPANIFITDHNTIKLLDFGIARLEQANFNLTTENELLGTPYYMSPEQNAREAMDHRSDIYSFGVLAFELVTKQRPYQSNSQFDLTLKHLAGEIPSARELCNEVPKWLDAVIATCMQKSREKRYDSMEEVLNYLESKQTSASNVSNENQNGKKENLWQRFQTKHNQNAIGQAYRTALITIKQLALVWLLVGVLLGLWIKTPLGPYSTAALLRTLFLIRGEIAAPKDIVIVALDDRSYQELEQSTRLPFPRKYWAEAITAVQATKPAAVIIDAVIQKENYDEAGNIALESALSLGPTAMMKAEIENPAYRESQRSSANNLNYVSDPRFSSAVDLEIPMLFMSRHGIVYSISLNGENVGQRLPLSKALELAGVTDFGTPGKRDFINFYGPPGTFTRISLYELLKPNQYDFKDKIVFLGMLSMKKSDVPGSYDVFSTSGAFSNLYFGVEIHATILCNLLDKSYIRGLSQLIELIFLTVMGLVFFSRILTKKPAAALKFYIIGLLLWFLATLFGFLFLKVLLPGVFLMLWITPIVFAGTWYFYARIADQELSEAESLTRIKLRKRTE